MQIGILSLFAFIKRHIFLIVSSVLERFLVMYEHKALIEEVFLSVFILLNIEVSSIWAAVLPKSGGWGICMLV